MSWAEAARRVSDEYAEAGRALSVPPDEPVEDDREFWRRVAELATPGRTREASRSRLREYSDDEPRDERGRWTSGGGGDTASQLQTLMSGGSVDVSTHDAIGLLHGMAASDRPVPLQNLSINGTPVFRGSMNIPRSEMPQVPHDAASMADFARTLDEHGVGYSFEQQSPLELHATQNQIDGRTVGRAVIAFDESRVKTVITASDGSILDGHHRWAASAAYALTNPDFRVPVLRTNADIGTLLGIARDYNAAHGIQPQDFGQGKGSIF